jgi:hypothetical protein
MDNPKPYCKPWNAGLASEPRAVGRTIAKLMDALQQVNGNIVDGPIIDDVVALKVKILESMRADG